MGIRRIKRQIAKARLQAMGVGNINSKMSKKKDPKDRDEMPNWKKALYGKTGSEAHRVQMNLGRLKKAKDKAKKEVSRRKIKRVSA